ncbi:MAG: hypothetical protein FWF51_00535 [Chitinivibrionia bacterium]|jgi:hypothetical protein|nr:hypothetical protein [Chitinivibrionia bacterium]
MFKFSFKAQLVLIFITVAAVVTVAVIFVNKQTEQTRMSQKRANVARDFGIQVVFMEKLVPPEIIIDSLKDFSGTVVDENGEHGGNYEVLIKKDTISADSIALTIISRGIFGNVTTGTHTEKILLISPDSVNWEPQKR